MKFFRHNFTYSGYMVTRDIRLDTIVSVESMVDSGGVCKIIINHGGYVTEIADRSVAKLFKEAWDGFVSWKDGK